ncbi:MAG: alpha/beta fold hydrolase [Ferrimicrobium sp.]|uniref:alpha/beta fold hydrolase n=1 Tax=Ferrimicrobium sp. TaxID=2926050 RepID=UPI002620AB70|nr:alpha/beta hydrolase [Ferrimicrobium sp.]MCL5973688.1 alpha/beta hydrolase [Actinomycetota bacterium]
MAVSFARIDTKDLEVVRWSPSSEVHSDLTAVLLHEGLGCVAMWKDFGYYLAENLGIPVLAYSRAGYGRSGPIELPRPLTYMEQEADRNLPPFLNKLCPGRRLLLGHSDGATIALAYAGTSHDPLLAGVIAIAPHVIVEELTLESIRQAKRDFQEGVLAEKLSRYHGANLDTAFWGWNDAWLDPGFRSFSILERLETITVPVLAIQGDLDPYGTTKQLELIASRCERTSTALIKNARHAPHLSHAQEVLTHVRRFVAMLNVQVHP